MQYDSLNMFELYYCFVDHVTHQFAVRMMQTQGAPERVLRRCNTYLSHSADTIKPMDSELEAEYQVYTTTLITYILLCT
jgi:hypothetical protein